MRKITIKNRTTVSINNSYEGESIETKMARITQSKEPIDSSAPIVFTERKDGVQPQYNIRTDKWEIAREAMNTVHKTDIAKRDEKPKEQEKKDGQAEPIQGTESKE